MRFITPRRSDQRLRTSTIAKIDRLERRIARLIQDDIDAWDAAQRAAGRDGVPRTKTGLRDERTAEYRAWARARSTPA